MALCRENLRFLAIGRRKRPGFGIARLFQSNCLLNRGPRLSKQPLLAQTVGHIVEIPGLVVAIATSFSWRTLLLDPFPQANAPVVQGNGLLSKRASLFMLLLLLCIITPCAQQVGPPCQQGGKVTKTGLLQIRMASKGLIEDVLSLGKAKCMAFC